MPGVAISDGSGRRKADRAGDGGGVPGCGRGVDDGGVGVVDSDVHLGESQGL